ncbi:MAG TPA: polyphenol oxidase family protein [Gaiellaceae bacterium]|nr:polyphenol oxidase family protein [Gaiellaceae bacterium]
MKVLEADLGAPYRVAFSTRLGGVSDGAYASLNLGILTEDAPDNVVENRRRLCAGLGVDPESATMAWQEHGAEVRRADGRGVVRPGTPLERCDGLWTDEPGRGVMLLAADCVPVALARANGRPALAVLHVGWRGLLAGIVAAGVEALGGGPVAAAVGPGIGPCHYEVGDEVAAPFRERFGADVVAGRRLDLPGATERALAAAGVDRVRRIELCTYCEEGLFFSHRRDRGVTGRQGVLAALR